MAPPPLAGWMRSNLTQLRRIKVPEHIGSFHLERNASVSGTNDSSAILSFTNAIPQPYHLRACQLLVSYDQWIRICSTDNARHAVRCCNYARKAVMRYERFNGSVFAR